MDGKTSRSSIDGEHLNSGTSRIRERDERRPCPSGAVPFISSRGSGQTRPYVRPLLAALAGTAGHAGSPSAAPRRPDEVHQAARKPPWEGRDTAFPGIRSPPKAGSRKKPGSRGGRLERRQLDGVAEVGEAAHEPPGLDLLGAAVEVVGAEVRVGGAVLEHGVGGGQDRGRDRAHRLPRPAAGTQALVRAWR